MIFDDLENDELAAPPYQQTKGSAKSSEFETSLDNLLNKKDDAPMAEQTTASLYEVFQIQLNERFCQLPSPDKYDKDEQSIQPPRRADKENFELRLKEASEHIEESCKHSLGLSLACDELERATNLEALNKESISSCSHSLNESQEPSLAVSKSKAKVVEEASIQENQSVDTFIRPHRKNSNYVQQKSRHKILKKKTKRFAEETYKIDQPYSTEEFAQPNWFISDSVTQLLSLRSLANLNLHPEKENGPQSLVSLDQLSDNPQSKMPLGKEFCRICNKQYMLRDLVARVMSCEHHFHKKCLEEYLQANERTADRIPCPECDKKLLSGS
jgi:hypothetical protein